LKYKVSVDGEETDCTAKDIYTLIDRFEKKHKYIDWIENDTGFRVAERLKPALATSQNKLKLR
jgi:hypothetical protein